MQLYFSFFYEKKIIIENKINENVNGNQTEKV